MRVEGKERKKLITPKGKTFISTLLGILALLVLVISGVNGGNAAENTNTSSFFIGFINQLGSLFIALSMLGVLGYLIWLFNKYVLEKIGRWWQNEGLPTVIEKYEISYLGFKSSNYNFFYIHYNISIKYCNINPVFQVLSFFQKTSLRAMYMFKLKPQLVQTLPIQKAMLMK